mmetsp:Transcript_13008/g.40047  ORF Transcript_13008/g.40047 Transcript_13008/m.40047 type:complete len:389 (-) Transcript_13008:123-1289(-)|eukprot:CAMPEP_0198735464 /NCGR_PEP_ID=MMETSP1475-20131203/59673_1 /TAXON_ID= ORGANISM="Unidentified sp., Strain CCMP1999" /NCGR_SAMPLE_ID=MMETSP1475 /ASSEMBLY_ACC=CAM_ASM_001111 /LENGTH=388 /DNA_ID=CAMNT_0044499133 /DNA_START=183 /DNA_END=1349 /DNA_ORIENTATION=+
MTNGTAFLHPSPRKEGTLVHRGLLGKRRMWCVADGAVLDVYKKKGDALPKYRLDSAEVRIGKDRKTLKVNDLSFVTDSADDFEAWRVCLDAQKPHRFERFYVKMEKIGKGSFSEVYLARSKEFGHLAALKSLDLKRKKSKRYLSYLLREVQFLGTINSAHVVNVLDIFTSRESIQIVMEYMDRGNLKTYLHERKLQEHQIQWIMYQILSGLKDLHAAGVVHRDISLNNVLLKHNEADSSRPTVKIADLGLALDIVNGSRADRKLAVGNLYNTAPEIFQKKGYSSSVDVWAAGMVCYELLAGYHPFRRSDMEQIAYDVGEVGKVPFPPIVWSKISPLAMSFTRTLLEADGSKRITAAEAMKHPFLLNARQRAGHKLPVRRSTTAPVLRL